MKNFIQLVSGIEKCTYLKTHKKRGGKLVYFHFTSSALDSLQSILRHCFWYENVQLSIFQHTDVSDSIHPSLECSVSSFYQFLRKLSILPSLARLAEESKVIMHSLHEEKMGNKKLKKMKKEEFRNLPKWGNNRHSRVIKHSYNKENNVKTQE